LPDRYEGFGDGRVELASGAAAEFGYRLVGRERKAVRALARHCVEGVDDGNDALAEWYLVLA
jgi:hypothetical protein